MSTNGTSHDDRRRYESITHRDVRVPTADPGITLSADVCLPVGANRVPALIMVLPYRKDMSGVALGAKMRWLTEHGYATVLVDLRGTGASDGDHRPEFDPGEADDAVATIEWVAAQPWCDGNVGMWGASYMGSMTLRTASRRVPALKAIIAMMCPLDPEQDLIHPNGTRGDLHPLVHRGSMMLARQILPPLANHTSPTDQHRWQKRLRDQEPVFVDFVSHPAGDPAWRDRAIDAASINTPALCVGGWRDKNTDSVPRAYELMQGPKKLLMGPWMHTSPEDSPFAAIDFPGIALRWWDHWLRGIDNGVMDEPPVTLYVQGHQPGWRSFDSWPPAKTELRLTTRSTTTLTLADSEPIEATDPIAEYRPDPTTGTLSGLWGLATPGFGLPLDQHDDDMRVVSATSEPVADDVVLCGRPEVTVRLAPASSNSAPRRLVVRLTDVDPHDRSTFIVAGVLVPPEATDTHDVTLWPTTYRLRAGHRFRVVVSDADFPRLTPVITADGFSLSNIALLVPTVRADAGESVTMPVVQKSRPDAPNRAHRWTITRDVINDGVQVVIGGDTPPTVANEGHIFEEQGQGEASVRRTEPGAAVASRTHTIRAKMTTGEDIVAVATVRCTQAALWARGEVTIDGLPVFSRTWDLPIRYEDEVCRDRLPRS